MKTYKKTLRSSMLVYGISFLAILCVLMAAQSGGMLKASLDQRNYDHLKDIVNYVEHTTDADDLRECIETLTPSEKYNELQQRLNTMVDDFEVRFIYIVIPSPESGKLISVCSSTSNAERAAGEEDYPIMFADEGFYSADQITPYAEAWNRIGEFSSYTSKSDFFGPCYTVCKPLCASNGEVVALICADMDLGTMHRSVNAYVASSVGLVVLITVFFGVIVALWIQKFVTDPLRKLEKSARGFAEKSHGKRDLDALSFDAPEIHTENEIQSLSDAISQMSEDMKNYVIDVLAAEKRAETAEGEVEDITKFANVDALTQAKSKVAYDAKKTELAAQVAEGKAKFAMVVVNLNNVKRINDFCGLEGGDKYLISAREVISDVYAASPVYRIGGDEFVVILEGDEYKDRDELFAVLEERFRAAEEDTGKELWERCSAAAGMTEFFADADENVDQVYRRAERIMMRNKRIMKNAAK